MSTCSSSVVGNVGGQVDAFAVNVQVSHASHEVPVSDGEVFWQVGDPSKEQGTCEVQGPTRTETQGFKSHVNLRLASWLHSVRWETEADMLRDQAHTTKVTDEKG